MRSLVQTTFYGIYQLQPQSKCKHKFKNVANKVSHHTQKYTHTIVSCSNQINQKIILDKEGIAIAPEKFMEKCSEF